MRLLLPALLALVIATAAPGATNGRDVSTAGLTLRVPDGWYAAILKTPSCDPERLIVVSSAPLSPSSGGHVAPPSVGQVVMLLLEDRYAQDRPVGNLKRPARFKVRWNNLVRLEPAGYCGSPNAPASMRYFKTHGRYLRFIIYPGPKLSAATRARTLAVMDSLRVSR